MTDQTTDDHADETDSTERFSIEDRAEAIRNDDRRFKLTMEATAADFVRFVYAHQLAAARFRDHSRDEAQAHLDLADSVLQAMPAGVRENLGAIGDEAQGLLTSDVGGALLDDDEDADETDQQFHPAEPSKPSKPSETDETAETDEPDEPDDGDALPDGGQPQKNAETGVYDLDMAVRLDLHAPPFGGMRPDVTEAASLSRDLIGAMMDCDERVQSVQTTAIRHVSADELDRAAQGWDDARDDDLVTDGGTELNAAPDAMSPGTLVVDRNLDGDEDAEADSDRAAVVTSVASIPARDFTVGKDETALPDFNSNPDDCGADQVVHVAFCDALDSLVPNWEDWVTDDDTDFQAALMDYTSDFRVDVQTYAYPWTRLRLLDAQPGETRPAETGQGSDDVKDAAVAPGDDLQTDGGQTVAQLDATDGWDGGLSKADLRRMSYHLDECASRLSKCRSIVTADAHLGDENLAAAVETLTELAETTQAAQTTTERAYVARLRESGQ